MKTHYYKILKDSDKLVQRFLDTQSLDQTKTDTYGGFFDLDGLIEPKSTVYRLTIMISCLFNKESHWYQNTLVYDRILLGLSYVKQSQRENGFFDYIFCNFYSAPDTAFCIRPILPVYEYLSQAMITDSLDPTVQKRGKEISISLEHVLKNAANAITKGGFHTPNHRWAIASVLLACHKLFQDETYKTAAEAYFVEGIDCNADGEYAERSAGTYNQVNNDAMILLGDVTGDPCYYDYARRNLYMMLTYIEPDGSVFTNNSTRQDRGKKVYPVFYYIQYLYLGIKLKDPTLLHAANYIMSIINDNRLHTFNFLIEFMNKPELLTYEFEGDDIPTDYNKHYVASNIVRCRRNQYSYSIINNSPSFLYFQHGNLTVSFKIGASFCEHRAFQSQKLIKKGNIYELSQKMTGWYYLPFETPPETSDWWEMDHTSRGQIKGPNMEFLLQVEEIQDGLNVRIKTEGIDRAPLRLEIAFDKDTRIESNGFMAEGIAGGGMVVKEGTVTASKGEYAIEVGPAFGAHNYIAGTFGSESRNQNCYTVYFTDFSCFDHAITLKALPSSY